MNSSRFKCYYSGCPKHFRNKIYLVTHINHHHLSTIVIRCERCELYFNSEEAFKAHKKTHNKPSMNNNFCSASFAAFNLYDEYEYNPPNLLSLPVLPLIESARSAKAYEYKLPLSVRLYELLTTCPDSERK